jgi:hypothetical protein
VAYILTKSIIDDQGHDWDITTPNNGDFFNHEYTRIYENFRHIKEENFVMNGSLTAGGGFTGNVTGNVTGDVTGNVTGNVIGNLLGNAATAIRAESAGIADSCPSVKQWIVKYAAFGVEREMPSYGNGFYRIIVGLFSYTPPTYTGHLYYRTIYCYVYGRSMSGFPVHERIHINDTNSLLCEDTGEYCFHLEGSDDWRIYIIEKWE